MAENLNAAGEPREAEETMRRLVLALTVECCLRGRALDFLLARGNPRQQENALIEAASLLEALRRLADRLELDPAELLGNAPPRHPGAGALDVFPGSRGMADEGMVLRALESLGKILS